VTASEQTPTINVNASTGVRTVWMCDPPPEGASYYCLDDEWDMERMVRYIHRIALV
jgi:hypothetical protein